jgi:thiol-disulfide isomerase/thioredoxin
MKAIFLILALLGLLFFYKKNQDETARARREYQRGVASGQDYCTEKKFCVLVYVAPWCPACKQMAPQLKTALLKSRSNKDYGFKVVVGQGTLAQNDNEAASFGLGATTDPESIVKTALGVDRYPSFFVLDKDSAVVLRDMEAYQWAAERFF